MPSRIVRDRAERVLIEAIDHCRSRNRDRLPTVRHMAARAGASVFTMSRVVHAYVDKGVLETLPGRGVRLVRAGDVPAGSWEHRVPAYERVMERIHEDIARGVFPAGAPLPSYKELQGRYGVSYATVKKALGILAPRTGLERFKRGYRVPLRRSRPGSTILFFVPVKESNWVLYSPRVNEVLRSTERCALQHRISLSFVPCGRANNAGQLRELLLRHENTSATIIGAMVWGNRLPCLRDLLVLLESRGRPVAVLDDANDLPPEVPSLRTRHVRLFELGADLEAAETIARFLLRGGHRHIAALTLSNRYAWSRARYDVLRRVFRGMGGDYTVDCFAIDSIVRGRGSGIRQFEEYYQTVVLVRELERLVQDFDTRSMLGAQLSRTVIRAYESLRALSTRGAYSRSLEAAFEHILTRPRITACVVFSDVVAQVLVEYIRRRNTADRATRPFSVVSFDNDLQSAVARITSYEYNVDGVIRAMFDYLIRPGLPRGPKPMERIRIAGFLLERQTEFWV